MRFSIVDIETTGAHAAAGGITEICIYVLENGQVIETFETLINPHKYIPPYISAMTGITNEMVEDAPSFKDVAEKIYSMLEGNVFVAHNVNFDYSFVKYQLEVCQYDLRVNKLCTVRLSRKIFPGLRSYSLGNLCRSLDIPLNNRHRAGGDTAATAILFQRLLANDEEQLIIKSLKRNSKEQVLPPNVPKEHFMNLPYCPGVYYFHNEKGKVIYTGKAKNIRYRVNSHFSNNSPSKQKQNFLIHTHAISYEPWGTELMAAIFESVEIKRLWPVFNSSQKSPEAQYGFFMYTDQNGYSRIAIEKVRKSMQPLYRFQYVVEGHNILRSLMRDFNLCPKLCFIQVSHDACEGMEQHYCNGACEQQEEPEIYNQRVEAALTSLKTDKTFVILDKGLQGNDQSCILVYQGEFYGMGYIQADDAVYDVEDLKDRLTRYKDNMVIRQLINSYVEKNPRKMKLLQPASVNDFQ